MFNVRPHPGPLAPATPPRGLAYMLIRVTLLILIAAAAAVLSVVASTLGLTLLLMILAVGSLMTLKIRQKQRGIHTSRQSRRAMVAVGLAVVGFFLMVSVVAAHWPK